jgi:hypothetical protein
MTRNARHLADARHLRDGISIGHAADVLWAYSSPQLWETLVLGRGWPAERDSAFITDAMTAALLPPGPPTRQARRHH